MSNRWLTIEREGQRVVLKKCSQEAEGEVIIPNGVTDIADLAFMQCGKVNEVFIPDSVTCIGMNAFVYCDLISIHIPASVTRFVPYSGGIIITCPFYGNPNLKSITVDNNNPVFDSRNECNAIIEKSTNRLILGCKNTIIPDSVSIIGNASFYGFTEPIPIPEGIVEIEQYAFYYCNFRKIVIPNKNTKIYRLSFWKSTKVIRGDFGQFQDDFDF